MLAVPQGLLSLAERLHAWQLVKSSAYGCLVYAGFVGVVYLLERRQGADLARYRTRHFANDVAYTLFYKGGFYSILLLAAVTNLLEPRLAFLKLDLLRGLPWPVGLALFWIAGDFLTYWWHRLQHANRFLWALHSVHHSQEQLNLLTASRRHPLENLSMDVLLYFVVFHLLLGIPTRGWMPLAAFIASVAAVQHAQLDWRFGPFARVFVSPRFHAVHHSAEAVHANANFGFLFSCWDHVFGTAMPDQARPSRYGVPDIDFGESLARQLVTPFALMWRWRRPADPRAGVAEEIAPGRAAMAVTSQAAGTLEGR